MFRVVRSSFRTLFQTKSRPDYVKCVAKYPANIEQFRFYSSKFDVNTWIETLDEAQQKRIRFVLNEVKSVNL